jgi:hypothetical protein
MMRLVGLAAVTLVPQTGRFNRVAHPLPTLADSCPVALPVLPTRR